MCWRRLSPYTCECKRVGAFPSLQRRGGCGTSLGFTVAAVYDRRRYYESYPPLPAGLRLEMILVGSTFLSTTTPKKPLIISSHVISP
jgi:hypothetical protein